jgi:hypothetical protein
MQNDNDGVTGTSRGLTIVRIAYRSPARPVPDSGREEPYVYYWPFREPPLPGQWVIVPDTPHPENYAVVTGFGNHGDAKGAPIKTITSLVPDEAGAEARKADADTVAWLWAAQRAAGFPAPGFPAPPDEDPYSPIPPATGTAPGADAANEYGFVWQRLHRQAEEYGLPDEQVKRFKSISEHWLTIAESWRAKTDQTSRSPDAVSGTDTTGSTVTTTSTSLWKWLLVLAAVILVVVVLVALVRSRNGDTEPAPGIWSPTSSRPTTSQSSSTCYRNVNGECVPQPSASNSLPGRATAECRDGTYSYSSHRSGSCADHGGVAVWLDSRP